MDLLMVIGVDDGVDDVCGCRTGIASCIVEANYIT